MHAYGLAYLRIDCQSAIVRDDGLYRDPIRCPTLSYRSAAGIQVPSFADGAELHKSIEKSRMDSAGWVPLDKVHSEAVSDEDNEVPRYHQASIFLLATAMQMACPNFERTSVWRNSYH